MQTTNSKTIEIKGMTGDDCVQKVTGALKSVAGVETQSVKVGTAAVTCEDQTRFDAACAAIRGVGFKAREFGTGRPPVDTAQAVSNKATPISSIPVASVPAAIPSAAVPSSPAVAVAAAPVAVAPVLTV